MEGRTKKAPRVVWLIVAAMTMMGAANATGQTDDQAAEIEVEWHDDDMGFDVTSSKALSNVIVLMCPDDAHKHEIGDEATAWSHREERVILEIWVKSGDNLAPEDEQPPAPFNDTSAGEHFVNEGADCEADVDDGADTPDSNETADAPDDGNETAGPDDNGTGAPSDGDDTAGGDRAEDCDGPQDIQAAADGPSIALDWSAVANASGYSLYRAEGDGDASLLATTPGDVTEYRDSAVEPGVTYSYHVTATVDGAETASCDHVQVTAIPVFPSSLAMVTASLVGVGCYALYRRRR